jgi:hypothetical protein
MTDLSARHMLKSLAIPPGISGLEPTVAGWSPADVTIEGDKLRAVTGSRACVDLFKRDATRFNSAVSNGKIDEI